MNARERPSEHSNWGAKPVNLRAAWEAITCQPWREMNVVTSTAECGRVSDIPCAWQLVRKSRPCYSQTRVKGTKALRWEPLPWAIELTIDVPAYTLEAGRVSHVQPPLPLSMYLRMTLNFCSLCLCFLNAEVTGTHHHTAYVLPGIKPRAFGNDREVLYWLSTPLSSCPAINWSACSPNVFNFQLETKWQKLKEIGESLWDVY